MIPHQLESVKRLMEKFVCTVIFDDSIFHPSPAYINTIYSEKRGKLMFMYVNSKDIELANFLYMHECGHIIFGHTESTEERMNAYLLEKIEGSFKKASNYFRKTHKSFDDYMNIFRNLLLNMAMDFEVNSRLFTEEEWEYFQQKLIDLTHNPTDRGMWPADFGFPLGLTWNEYLTMIFMKPSVFFRKLEEKIAQARAEKSHIEKYGYEEFNGKLTANEYRKFRDECAKGYFSKEELKEIEKIAKSNGNSQFAIPTGQMNGMSRDKSLPARIDFDYWTSMDELLREIKKILFEKKHAGSLRNQMYNANRRKYNSDVIIPKDLRFEKQRRPDLFLVIDVSGSVDAEMVYDFVCTFKTVKKEFKHTQLIYWTTELVHECSIDDPSPNQFAGGTYISLGIDYVQQKYAPKPKDAIFVISDFEDNMNEWEVSLKKMTCRKFAINWNPKESETNPGFSKILKKV